MASEMLIKRDVKEPWKKTLGGFHTLRSERRINEKERIYTG